MHTILAEVRRAVLLTLVLAAVCCGLYPLAIFAVAQTCFTAKANGSLIVDAAGTVRGSKLIGQGFTTAPYFHSRPSAAGAGYDAANSCGSNLGPTSQKLHDAVKVRLAQFRTENGMQSDAPVPADAVTASGGGLDPHISVANAELQVARVARIRGLDAARVQALIREHTEPRTFGLLGESGVNVLLLNLALDVAQSLE